MSDVTLTPGCVLHYDGDDLGTFDMTYTGRTTNPAGRVMFKFDCPARIGGLTLSPTAFDNHVRVGTITDSN